MLLVMTAAVAACIAGCSKEDIEAAREAGLHLVAIVPPNASDERVARIAGLTSGYTYLLSRVGITGTDHASGTPRARPQSASSATSRGPRPRPPCSASASPRPDTSGARSKRAPQASSWAPPS